MRAMGEKLGILELFYEPSWNGRISHVTCYFGLKFWLPLAVKHPLNLPWTGENLDCATVVLLTCGPGTSITPSQGKGPCKYLMFSRETTNQSPEEMILLNCPTPLSHGRGAVGSWSDFFTRDWRSSRCMRMGCRWEGARPNNFYLFIALGEP